MLTRRQYLILFFLATAGCFTPPNHLTVTPNRSATPYRQKFTSCYMMRMPAGDYHFLLAASGIVPRKDQRPDEPLQPSTVPPLQQIVHIHVFWRPQKGAKPDNPSSTNASIDWYFIANMGMQNQSVVHYYGGGFVTVNPSTKSAAVHVRSMALSLRSVEGTLHDPLGAGNVTGDFVALLDPGQVRDLLSEIKKLND